MKFKKEKQQIVGDACPSEDAAFMFFNEIESELAQGRPAVHVEVITDAEGGRHFMPVLTWYAIKKESDNA
jgi:hypothetical protein